MASLTGRLSAPFFYAVCGILFLGNLIGAIFWTDFRKWGVGLSLCALAACLGFLLFNGGLSRAEAGILPEGDYVITGVVCDSQEGSLILDGVEVDGRAIGKVQLFAEGIELGTRVEAEVSMSPVTLVEGGTVNTYSVRTGISYFARADQIRQTGREKNLLIAVRGAIMKVFEENLHEDIWPLADALVLGNKTFVEDARMENYRAAGIVHIFAISGLHVGFLTGVIFWLFDRARAPYWLRLPLTAVLLAAYAALCNFSPSVIRASLMACLLLLSKCLFQKYDMLNSLSVAWLLILLFQPLFLFDAGFLMSFSTLFGIWLMSGRIQRLLRFLPAFLRNGISVSVSAQIGIMPAMLIFFRSVPVWSVLANLLAIPLVTICYLTLMIFLLLTLLLPFLGFLLTIPQILLEIIDSVAMLFASVPGIGEVLLPLGGSALIYYAAAATASDRIFLRRGARALLCGCLCLSFVGCYLFAYTPAPVREDLYMLAADQPLFVVETQGKRILIDLSTGANDYEEVEYLLRTFRLTKIDAVLAPREGNQFLSLYRELWRVEPERYYLGPAYEEETTAARDYLRAQGITVTELSENQIRLEGIRLDFFGEDRSVIFLEGEHLTALLEWKGEEEAKMEVRSKRLPPIGLLFSDDEELGEGLKPDFWVKNGGKEVGEGQIYSLSHLGSLIFRAGCVIIN